MNIYEDYLSYMSECESFLSDLRKGSSRVLLLVDDAIKLADYICALYVKNKQVEKQLEEIFNMTFRFLAETLSYIKSFYEESFDKDIEKINKYSDAIIYLIILEDFKQYIRQYLNDNEEIKEEITHYEEKLDLAIANQKDIASDYIEEIDGVLEKHIKDNIPFLPTYIVLSLIYEEIEKQHKI